MAFVSTCISVFGRAGGGNGCRVPILAALFFLTGVLKGMTTFPNPEYIIGIDDGDRVRVAGTVTQVRLSGPMVKLTLDESDVELIYRGVKKRRVKGVTLHYFSKKRPWMLRNGSRVVALGSAHPLRFFKGSSVYHLNLLLSGSNLKVNSSLNNIMSFDPPYVPGFRHKALKRIKQALHAHLSPGPGREFLETITTGRRRYDGESAKILVNSGLAHLMAISGLHVGVAVLLVASIVRLLLVYAQTKGALFNANPPSILAGCVAALIYAYICGMEVPVLRACSMILFACFGAGKKDEGPDFKPLFFAALVIILSDPGSVVTPSFIFSFLISGELVILFSSSRYLRNQPLKSVVACSLSAYLVSVPLSALFFGGVATFGFAYNIVFLPLFIPLIAMSIIWEFLLLMGARWISPLVSVPGVLAEYLMNIIRALNGFTGVQLKVESPSLTYSIIYLLLLFVILWMSLPPQKKKVKSRLF